MRSTETGIGHRSSDIDLVDLFMAWNKIDDKKAVAISGSLF
jgi:hypothetical protein